MHCLVDKDPRVAPQGNVCHVFSTNRCQRSTSSPQHQLTDLSISGMQICFRGLGCLPSGREPGAHIIYSRSQFLL